ncbi:MAG TPA: serine/threonine-protein kinase [Pyrinomonadaceae bacterium]|nr:serine/threonine-protein kinase [Pyrinomonadaceae bacterium]
MNPATWKTIKETFATALELPARERDQFLAKSSDEIRGEVEKLLATYKEAQTFINTPLIVEKGLRRNGHEESLTGKQIDDYFVLDKLGEGGMGTVFLAEHVGQGFSQRVALKLIKRGMDTNAVLGRFLMERQILAGLEHPNIARLYGGGSTGDGLPYFVMEYVEGQTIRDFCENRQFDITERLRLFNKVCGAISYAHQQLIVHRDIKPSNIIVTASGEPKLLDFGIAKLLTPDAREAERTATQFHVMTPEYASPEQLTGKQTTTATDVYSLGVVLYELLTGARPFKMKGKSPLEISQALLSQEPMRPSDCAMNTDAARQIPTKATTGNRATIAVNHRQSVKRGLKGDLDNIILQAIRREPHRRYQSVVELSDDIERYLAGLPVKATADTSLYRAGKFISRHRAMVAATCCFILLLVASTALTGWQYFVARAQKAKSEKRLNELRSVAKSLLTETGAQLKQMPQGFEIRKSIVEKSVAVLDNLAGDESNDPKFLNELADAYAELGKIRHWQFHESRQALSDLNKAFQMRMRAITLEPKNVEHRKQLSFTLLTLSEVYGSLADREGSLQVWQKHLDNDLHMIELEPNNPRAYYTAAVHSEDLALSMREFNRPEESTAALSHGLEWAEKAIMLQQAAPFSIDGQIVVVEASMEKAALLHLMRRDDEALAVYQAAADLSQQTFFADKSKMFAFNHASRIHRHMADIYAERGDWQKYLECSEWSVNWIKQNRESWVLWNGGGAPTTTYYQMRVSIGLNQLGRKDAATANMDQAVNEFNQQMASHENHGEDIIYANDFQNPAADFYVETGQVNKAAAIWDRYIAMIDPFVTRNPQDTSSLGYLSYAYERKGDALAIYQKESEGFAQTNISNLRTALASYTAAIERRQRILQLDPTNQSHLDAEKNLAQKIARLKSRIS